MKRLVLISGLFIAVVCGLTYWGIRASRKPIQDADLRPTHIPLPDDPWNMKDPSFRIPF